MRDIQIQICVPAHRECELRSVEHLDGQATANLHLGFIECSIQAQSSRCRPVAHRVRAELLEQTHGGHNIALRLRHLLVIRVQDPSGKTGMCPRECAKFQIGADDR